MSSFGKRTAQSADPDQVVLPRWKTRKHKDQYNEWSRKKRVVDSDWREKRNSQSRERYQDRVKDPEFRRLYIEEMLEQQDGLCAICGNEETATYMGRLKELCIDHDHSTGVVRGLICNNCNIGLGRFKDNPENLWKAFDYLIKHGGAV